MPKADPIITAFVGGEFSPALKGRVDIEKYYTACETLENLLVRPYGPAKSTPGTEYISSVKDPTGGTVRLLQFQFSRTDSYIIEFGDSYFRFFTDGGIVVTSGTTPYELAHTFTEDELFDVQFVQLHDVIYMAHPDHKPQKLTRLASNSWTIEDFNFLGGPFLADNSTDITITASATTGTVSLTLSATNSTLKFDSGHVGAYWKVGGEVSSGNLSIQGYVQITAVSSSTLAYGTVIETLSTSAATTEFAEGAWSDYRGYPACITFHERRLVFARTDYEPQKIWASESFVYDSYAVGADDDDALNFQVASSEGNEIKWLSSANALCVGTYGGEFIISSGSDEPLTASNINARHPSSWGSEGIQPINVSGYVYYVQRFGKKLRELSYYWEKDAYRSIDATVFAEHITGDGIVDIAYQQNPEPVIWCVTTGGTIATLSREIDQQVLAWSRQTTEGYYESIATIPNRTEPYDEVWVVVKREIDGTNYRYIERFASPIVPDRQDKCKYLHSYLEYDGYSATSSGTVNISLSATSGTVTVTSSGAYFSADDEGQRIRAIDSDGNMLGELKITTYSSSTVVIGTVKSTFSTTAYSGGDWALSVDTISGLDHLEGETVRVLADGGLDAPDKTVSSGTITLAYDYFVVTAGLQYTSTLYTLPLEAGAARGTAQGKIQKIYQLALRVNNSFAGFKVGGSSSYAERVRFRNPSTEMGVPEALYTGIISNINFRDDFKYGSQVMIINEQPLPIEILSIMPQMETYEK